ncbi:MAG: ATP-binding protein [Myxococcales bacterium]
MKLSDFIRTHHGPIVKEWEQFAATLLPAAGGMNTPALRDHVKEILDAIVADLELPQDALEQTEKSQGHGEKHRMETVGKMHAALRIENGFKLSQLVGEYRALRASVLRLFEKTSGSACPDLSQVTRFNEAVDEALVEATDRFMLVMNRTSDQFLAVLGHDLRNPLGAITMSAALISRRGEDKSAKAASLILTSAERMKRMVHDLLDLTRTRLGSGIPITPEPMDLATLCREVVDELEAFHPDRRLEFDSTGDLRGTWDRDRLAQVISNLVGNALQHGAPNRPIGVRARVDGEEVTVEVHNEGHVIPHAELTNVFEPMVRKPAGAEDNGLRSLGLGLYIAREIVLAHGGTVSVKSTAREGTTFSVHLPRRADAVSHSSGTGKRLDQRDATGGIVVPEGQPPSMH